MILFEGTRDPLLTTARKQIRASQDLANAWQQRLKSPVPLVALKQTEANSELTSDEIDDLIVDWETARRESGTGFVPYGFDAVAMGVVAPDLYIAGRNADRLDWANLTGVPASLLEGSTSTASLTYSTAEGKRGELVDYSLSAWALPFEARLSQDDVTPPGTYVRFDLHWLTNPVQPGRNPGSED